MPGHRDEQERLKVLAGLRGGILSPSPRLTGLALADARRATPPCQEPPPRQSSLFGCGQSGRVLPGLPSALRAYDAERRRSAQRIAFASRNLHRFMAAEHTRLRDLLVRVYARLAPALGPG
ncbi:MULTISPECIES: hypothetical protein [Streptomyces]|uniref:hypothetical protein n=1 Tax=Streptomyces TaxID=1883 RepID=UPI0009989E99|nr:MULTISPECIES: hypothetical protein [Streptomyces]